MGSAVADGPDLSCFDFGSDSEDGEARALSSAKRAAGTDPATGAADVKKLIKSHRQEEQKLRTEAKEKKFSLPKADRAARAAIDDELERLLSEMQHRQAAELAEAGGDPSSDAAGALAQLSLSESSSGAGAGSSARKGSKAAKQRVKREEEERNREKRMQAVKANAGPSLREEELRRLAKVLAPHALRVYDIAADGHCLYRSLAHQLADGADDSAIDFKYCRKLAADHIRSHPDDFLPYLLAEHDFSDGLLDSYCSQVEGSSEWGGQLEITAIAHATRRAVVVFSADAPELLTGAEYEGNGPRLKLAYHRHYYGLGEHYNSLVPIH